MNKLQKIGAGVAGLFLSTQVWAQTATPVDAGVTAAVTDVEAMITNNAGAILGVVALVAGLVLFLRLIKRH